MTNPSAGTIPSELDLLEQIRHSACSSHAGVVLGIGDDCAIFRPRGSRHDLLFTTDLLIEGTHFRRATHTAAEVGWKTLARGLSDIAAMGGEARFCLLSLALAKWQSRQWVEDFYSGLLQLARREGVVLAGGDLSHTRTATCDIVVCGAVPRGRALRRDGARPGDALYVSGVLGGSALGLRLGRRNPDAWARHVRPQPRLALGSLIRKLGATAAMDLSDGLSLDLKRLCRASKLAAEITGPPLFPGATLQQALHGGEDYELLFAVPPKTKVPAQFQGVRLTRIGQLRQGRAGYVRLDGRALPALGYDHFRK